MSLEILQHELQGLLITAVQSNRVAAYFEIASIAVLVYDYLLTLKLEIGLVWGTPWNAGKVLFLLTRYPVFIDSSLLGYFHLSGGKADSIETCHVLYLISGWMILLGIGTAELVLIFRTWAIWGQSRKIAIGLLAFYFSVGIPSMYLTYLGINSVRYMQSPVPLVQRCFLIKVNDRIMLLDYLVILTVETVILVLTLVKGVYHYRHSKSSLVSTLFKDGFLYYIYLTACSIANVFVLAFPDKTHGASLILLQRVFHSIFTARILLDPRLAVARDGRDATTSATSPVLTTMVIVSQDRQVSASVVRTETRSSHETTNLDYHGLV